MFAPFFRKESRDECGNAARYANTVARSTMLAYDLSWNFLWPMLLIIPGAMALIGAATNEEQTNTTA